MKINCKWNGKKFDIPNEQQKLDWLKYLESMIDVPSTLEFKRRVNKRSVNANNYYWGVIVPYYVIGLHKHIMNQIGDNIDKTTKLLLQFYLDTDKKAKSQLAHNKLKAYYLNENPEITHNIDGIVKTSQMSSMEFEDYALTCRTFIDTYFNQYLGKLTPLPNENLTEVIDKETGELTILEYETDKILLEFKEM